MRLATRTTTAERKLTAAELFARNPVAAALLQGTMRISQAQQQRALRTAKPIVVIAEPKRDLSREYRWSSSSRMRQGMSR